MGEIQKVKAAKLTDVKISTDFNENNVLIKIVV